MVGFEGQETRPLPLDTKNAKPPYLVPQIPTKTKRLVGGDIGIFKKIHRWYNANTNIQDKES